ncbi:MAG: TonB-dependent receptor, partial [Deltaproteobacteria bacterium]|nr:TonB-dependent receptor [Deltaproteobacteria bacterium]
MIRSTIPRLVLCGWLLPSPVLAGPEQPDGAGVWSAAPDGLVPPACSVAAGPAAEQGGGCVDAVVTLRADVRVNRLPASAGEQRIDGPLLQARPHRSADDLLRAAPGLLAVRHGAEGKGQQLFLRGFDAVHGSDVEVLVDGLPVNEPSNVHGHGYVDLAFLPAELVESVQVLPGPFDPEQGDFATAGTVRLHLGVPADQRGLRLGYEAGTTNRHRLSLVGSPRSGSGSFVAAELTTDEGYGEDRASRRAALLGRLDVGPELTAGLHLGEFGSPNAVRLEDWRQGRLGLRDTYIHGLAGSSARAFATMRGRLSLAAHDISALATASLRRFALESNYTGYLYHPQSGDGVRQTHEAWLALLALRWEKRPARRPWSLVPAAGLQLRVDGLDQDQAAIAAPGGDPLARQREASGQIVRASLPLGLTVRPARWLVAEAGARLDWLWLRLADGLPGGGEHTASPWAVLPRLRLRSMVGESWMLFFAYGRGFRSPELRSAGAGALPGEDVLLDRYRGGEPEITVSDSLESGLRLAAGPLVLTGAGFATFIEHEQVFDHISGTNLELNPTRRLGVSLGLSLQPLPWLWLRADADAVRARFVESGNPVPGAPWLLSTFAIGASHPAGWQFGLSGLYLAPR